MGKKLSSPLSKQYRSRAETLRLRARREKAEYQAMREAVLTEMFAPEKLGTVQIYSKFCVRCQTTKYCVEHVLGPLPKEVK